MLPDIRAVVAALVAAVGLLMVSFALVAAFRVAQENRSTTLQAPLAASANVSAARAEPQRAVMIVETPGPHLAPVPPALDPPITVKVAHIAEASPEPVPVVRVESGPIAPIAALVPAEPSPAELPKEPPMGGPLVAEPPAPKADVPRIAAVEPAQRDLEKKVAEQKAAEKKAAAERARKARIAREKKRETAAHRAAQARAAKQKADPFGNNQFGNGTFGGTFTSQQ